MQWWFLRNKHPVLFSYLYLFFYSPFDTDSHEIFFLLKAYVMICACPATVKTLKELGWSLFKTGFV